MAVALVNVLLSSNALNKICEIIRWLAGVLQEQDVDTLWFQSKFLGGKTEVRKESLLKSFKDRCVCLPLFLEPEGATIAIIHL